MLLAKHEGILEEIEKELSECGRSLKDVLHSAVDEKKSGKIVIEVRKGKLEHTLEDSGTESLYKQYPGLQDIFKEAHQVPHWTV